MDRRNFIEVGVAGGVATFLPLDTDVHQGDSFSTEEGAMVLRTKIDGVDYAIGLRFSDFPDPNTLVKAIKALAGSGISTLAERTTLLDGATFNGEVWRSKGP